MKYNGDFLDWKKWEKQKRHMCFFCKRYEALYQYRETKLYRWHRCLYCYFDVRTKKMDPKLVEKLRLEEDARRQIPLLNYGTKTKTNKNLRT